MDDMNTNREHLPLFTVERVLLLVILVLQAVILVWLWKEHVSVRSEQGVTKNIAEPSMVEPAQQRNADKRHNHISRQDNIARLHEAHRMFQEMDQMFASAIGEFGPMGAFANLDDGWDALMASPAMDMKERDNSYVVVFSLPGATSSNVTVTLEGQILTVTTAVHGETGLKSRVGTFERSIQFPGPVGDPRLAQAVLTNSILRVSVPKGDGADKSDKTLRLL